MANKAIRGITVEIGGNTDKLGKALESSEKQSRSLQTELREIEKLLKFDPTNVELLAQKQDVLKDSIVATTKKLDDLKEAEKQVIAQFERGEIAENQLRAFQREIAQTENALDGMKDELSRTERAIKDLADGTDSAEKHTEEYREAVEKARKELDDFKDKASETFETLKTGAGVLAGAAVAAGGYALKVSTDFDKALNTLMTQTGASNDELVELNETMEAVYANNFGESIEDVAQSMATVKQNTKLSGEELQKTTEYALLMRDTFDMDVNESIRAVNSLMDQFGLTSEEAYNLIAQGAQNGLNQNDDLLDTINEYSVQFKDAGYTAENMFNMLANGAETGTWSVDKLGDAVKEFNIRASDGTVSETILDNAKAFGLSKKEAETLAKQVAGGNVGAYQKLADKLREIDSDTERYTLGVEMFGTMWEDLGEETVLALLETQGEISKTSDALERINDVKYDDIGSSLQGLKRTVETELIAPIGDELTPLVKEAIDFVQDNAPEIKDIFLEIVRAVSDFVGYILDNGDQIVSTIVGIGTGMLVWNVASTINSVVGAIKAYKLANEGATIAQALFNAVLNANPLMLIVTIIAAVVAAIVTFIATNDEARAKFVEIWEAIKKKIGEIVDAIVQWFSETLPKIGEFFVNLWNQITDVFSVAGAWFNDNVIQPIINAFNAVIDWFKNALTWFNENIIVPISNFYQTWIAPVVNKIIEMAQKMVELIGAIFVGLWNLLRIKVIDPIVNGFKSMWSKVSGFFSKLWADIVAIWQKVYSWFNSVVIQPVVNVFKSLWTNVSNSAQNAWSKIKSVFGSVKSWFSTTFSNAWQAVKNVFSGWGAFWDGLWTKIKNKFSSIGSNIAGAISSSIKSGLNSVISSVERIINSGISLINSAINLANKLPGVNVGTIGRLNLPRLARGGIIDSPTIAQIGEDGREAVIPLERNTEWLNELADKLNARMGGMNGANLEAVNNSLNRIYERLERLQVVLDSGELVGGIIDPVDTALNDKYNKVARGW